MAGPVYGLEAVQTQTNGCRVQSCVTLRRSFRPSKPIPTGSGHYDFVWYNSPMRAIVPRDVGSYSYAGTGYANPHAVISVTRYRLRASEIILSVTTP